jgi:hypothetical protein
MYRDSIRASSRPVTKLPADVWVCTRCGYLSDNGKPHPTMECASCRLAQSEPKRVQTFREVASGIPGLTTPCRAWLREFSDDDQPIDGNGFAVMPGHRICGHSDCVAPSHVESSDALLVA